MLWAVARRACVDPGGTGEQAGKLPMSIRATRLVDAPIIRPDMDAHMGDNVNGPSLIRAPEWLSETEAGGLGEYYLYFAHHKGRYIRLAHADDLTGPWTTYEPGTLRRAIGHHV